LDFNEIVTAILYIKSMLLYIVLVMGNDA
jgi:hypothetical protein